MQTNNHTKQTLLNVEVIYAQSTTQIFHYTFEVVDGTSILDAVLASPLSSDCPSLDIKATPMGIFSKKVTNPKTQFVKEGDRIELYRPILVDPKIMRKKRASQSLKTKK